MKKLLTFIFSLHLILQSFACVNEFDYSPIGKKGHVMPIDGVVHQSMTKSKVELEKEALALLALYNSTKHLNHYSDYAAKLIYLGKYAAAKSIYFEIENLKPNQYTTASNLGTIYELTGKNDSALFWIKKAVKLNPASHGGSEWIHIKILEFKLSKEKDYTKSILGLDFGNRAIPKTLDVKFDSSFHISHQLSERLNFISPPNKIMGNIYFDFGNSIAFDAGISEALRAYEEAKRFGFESPIMDKRIAHFKGILEKHQKKNVVFKEDLKSDTVVVVEKEITDSSSIVTETTTVTTQMQMTEVQKDAHEVVKPQIDPKNGFIRTGLIVMGGFVFLFVMFLVFRFKK